jgi:hypothetical protein
MKNTEDNQGHPSQGNNEMEDTLPSMPIPPELRAKLDEGEPQTQSPDVVRYRSYDAETLSQQDEITTPPPLTAYPEQVEKEPHPRRASGAMRVMVGLCLVISLASLALNGLLIYSLLNTREAAVEGLDAAIDALDSFGGKGFHYEYKFEEVIPFSGDIPFKQDLVFPFEGDIPINTTIEVPITFAGQEFTVRVPIDTSVYIDTAVPISVDQTVHVSTSLPVSLVIPIDVKPDDPTVQGLLSNVREWLVRLRESF